MGAEEVLLNSLKLASQQDQGLTFLNTYKGMPVMYPVRVARFGVDQVAVIFSENPGAICLKLEKRATILGPSLDEPVTASVLTADLAAGTAILGSFNYAGSSAADQMALRVEPREPLHAQLNCAGRSLNARVLTVALNELSLELSERDANVLRPLALASMELTLPEASLRLAGLLRSVRPEAEHFRVILSFTTPQIAEMARYLLKRSVEILAELPQLHQALLLRARAGGVTGPLTDPNAGAR